MNSFVALVAVVCMCGQAYGGWTEVWRDDFNGNSLDQNNWKLETGTGQNGWGNGEMEYYTNGQNLQVQNGVLTITARVEDVENSHFTSSRLNSKNAWAYGKFEARARLPKGKNLWPAIWLFPQSNTYGGWYAVI
ncbi:unnamed protein product [Oppiella nova]|uniref:GH16 domain-containing protein n=1 Tax=Oppiella nova TaxID=334625 RepID=A0A7R9QS59_9ACAR|nr:unnamed protein product [Oppiella nova]CAG2173423.1 unnamed protein product [Oppiella nova]